jgi:glycosyltransferase involved in cell wall biosynthesis
MRPDASLERDGTILSVGPGLYYKNFPTLLHALAQPVLAAARMVRVGETRPEHLALAAELGVLDRIEQTGRVSDDELIRRYQTCAVLAQPSYNEGFGLPVAEAMLCGLPVVVSDGGALPEVAGSAGKVVPLRTRRPRQPVNMDDARDLAATLAEVLGDQALRRRMSETGLSEAERFRPASVRPRLLDAYAHAAELAKARNGA